MSSQAAAERVQKVAQPVVGGFSRLGSAAAILCFGSYALATYDQYSDIDLYVLCYPKFVSERERRAVITQLPEVADIHMQHAGAAGWDSPWAPQSDKFKLGQAKFEVAYNTTDWVSAVVREVVATGATSVPAMPFRPYTLLGLLASALPLYDPQGFLDQLKTQMFPYPAQLKEKIIDEFVPIMCEGLAELRDYKERNIGNTAFLFYLLRVCDAMASVLYALNEVYDPATKRPEQEFRKLERIPKNFVKRYKALLEGPFVFSKRAQLVDELAVLMDEVVQLSVASKEPGDKM